MLAATPNSDGRNQLPVDQSKGDPYCHYIRKRWPA